MTEHSRDQEIVLEGLKYFGIISENVWNDSGEFRVVRVASDKPISIFFSLSILKLIKIKK